MRGWWKDRSRKRVSTLPKAVPAKHFIAAETFDLALNQGGPHQTERIPVWTTFLNCTSQIAFAASIVSVFERVSPIPIGSAAGDAMLALSHHVKADVARSSDALGQNRMPGSLEGRSPEESLARLQRLVDEDLPATVATIKWAGGGIVSDDPGVLGRLASPVPLARGPGQRTGHRGGRCDSTRLRRSLPDVEPFDLGERLIEDHQVPPAPRPRSRHTAGRRAAG